jgi:hypothetical protein
MASNTRLFLNVNKLRASHESKRRTSVSAVLIIDDSIASLIQDPLADKINLAELDNLSYIYFKLNIYSSGIICEQLKPLRHLKYSQYLHVRGSILQPTTAVASGLASDAVGTTTNLSFPRSSARRTLKLSCSHWLDWKYSTRSEYVLSC